MFSGALDLGLEGVVAKDSKSPTSRDPAWHWQKIKDRNYKRQEKIEFSSTKN